MKIDQNVVALKSAQPDTPIRPRTGAASASAAPSASVATHLPLAGGDFDAARVAEIRAAIAEGRYQVDASRIADGLLDQVRDLLGERK